MPTYEYTCTDCGTDHEIQQSIHDDPLTRCPDCGGRLRKIFGNVGVVFKGSGFYRTDSRADAERAGQKTSGKEDKAQTGAGDGKGGEGSGKAAKEGGGSDSGAKTNGKSGDGGDTGASESRKPAKAASGGKK